MPPNVTLTFEQYVSTTKGMKLAMKCVDKERNV